LDRHFCQGCHENTAELMEMLRDKNFASCPCKGGRCESAATDTDTVGTSFSTAATLPRRVHVRPNGGWDELKKQGDREADDNEHIPPDVCPLLATAHPPTGEEFALGCSLCKSRKTGTDGTAPSKAKPNA
jgi:hypothetical protein